MPRTHTRRLALTAALLIPASASQLGCARQLTEDFITALVASTDTLAQEVVRPMTRAAVDEAGITLEETVAPRLGRIVDSLAQNVEPIVARIMGGATDSVELLVSHLTDSLTHFIRDDVNAALSTILSENMPIVRDSIDRALVRWIETLAQSADSFLRPTLAKTADSALAQLAVSFDTSGAVGKALLTLTASVVDRAIAQLQPGENTPAWVWVLFAALGLVVISIVGRFIIALKQALRERDESLKVVSLAIKQHKDDVGLAEEVKTLALQRGVESSLHRFLEEERLLVNT